jgi:hypothetical protein
MLHTREARLDPEVYRNERQNHRNADLTFVRLRGTDNILNHHNIRGTGVAEGPSGYSSIAFAAERSDAVRNLTMVQFVVAIVEICLWR